MIRANDTVNYAEVFGQTENHLYFLSDRLAIHKDMKHNFVALQDATKEQGFELKIASGYRSFDRQLSLWNNKFSGKTVLKTKTGEIVKSKDLSEHQLIYQILLYSALPGASRHHWGCDIDVYAPNLLAENEQLQLETWEYERDGPFDELSQWLRLNAHSYGFYLPYASFEGGVAFEPWHLSYLPLAQKYQQAFNINKLANVIKLSNILGKKIILENLDEIASRFINNVTEAPNNVRIETLNPFN
jgi:LAS superfamily LD-carboxypeptidase LdcB